MDVGDLKRGIKKILVDDSLLKSISTSGVERGEDTGKDIFGPEYDTYRVSIGDEAYDKPIRVAIGIPKKRIDPEATEQEEREPNLLTFERELERFQRMLPELMKTYAHEFVAILNGAVVDHDKDELKLAKRVYRKYLSEFVLVREVKKEVPVIFALESPEGVVR